MPIRNVFSQRHAPEKIGPLIFNEIPYKLKNQVYHIWDDFLNQRKIAPDTRRKAWKGIFKSVCKEHGFGKTIYQNLHASKLPNDQVENYYNSFSLSEVDKHLDIFEIIFYEMRRIQIYYAKNRKPLIINYEASVKLLNERFIENNFGYRFEQQQIIQIENEYHYIEIVKPTFDLLKDERFLNVNQEFLAAHAYFRKRLFEPSIVECAKALESCLKIICHELSWEYDQRDTAAILIKRIIYNGLIPKYFENSLIGIATARNKTSAHGKGVEELTVNEHLALFVLNQTAGAIMYLIASFKFLNESTKRRPTI